MVRRSHIGSTRSCTLRSSLGFTFGPRSGRKHFPHCSLVLRYPPIDATNPLIRVGYLRESVLQYNLLLTRPCSPLLCISSATPGFRLALFLTLTYRGHLFSSSPCPSLHPTNAASPLQVLAMPRLMPARLQPRLCCLPSGFRLFKDVGPWSSSFRSGSPFPSSTSISSVRATT